VNGTIPGACENSGKGGTVAGTAVTVGIDGDK